MSSYSYHHPPHTPLTKPTFHSVGGQTSNKERRRVRASQNSRSPSRSSRRAPPSTASICDTPISLSPIRKPRIPLYDPQSNSNCQVKDATVRVVLRIRPPLERELHGTRSRRFSSCTAVEKSKRAVIVSDTSTGDDEHGLYARQSFAFDHVYDQDSSQAQVYETTARDAVTSVLQGYNASIIAYGQTGSGKTYTMEGFDNEMQRGIIPRAIEEIFAYIYNAAGPTMRFLVRASYLQIYNEVISDLLQPQRTNLTIRQDPAKGLFVEGLSEWVVRTPAEIHALIKRGSSQRATSQTKLNDMSSRSHAIFIVIVEQHSITVKNENSSQVSDDEDAPKCLRTPSATSKASEPLATPGSTTSDASSLPNTPRSGQSDSYSMGNQTDSSGVMTPNSNQRVQQTFRVGKLNLVDLAGSERVRVSGAVGKQLEESKQINRSLAALGNVIAALTDTKGRSHVPYRDSKLTRILEDSLGGNCITTVMAMISPALESFLESVSTLKFATRAKRIKNTAVINEDLDEKTLLRRYERELKRLRKRLQQRSKNVVDKRRLLELEAQRNRAERDKLAAIIDLERLSRDLMHEKAQKRKLQNRIKKMSEKLLDGGGDSLEKSREFKVAIRKEQQRIRSYYAKKVEQYEKERTSIEEDKAQVGRYKQLLIKQRDIMIQLTSRLNERDQSILALQEELDAYEKQQRLMEDALDEKRDALLKLQRSAMKQQGLGSGSIISEQSPSQTDDNSSSSSDGISDGVVASGKSGIRTREKSYELEAAKENLPSNSSLNHRLPMEVTLAEVDEFPQSPSMRSFSGGNYNANVELQKLQDVVTELERKNAELMATQQATEAALDTSAATGDPQSRLAVLSRELEQWKQSHAHLENQLTETSSSSLHKEEKVHYERKISELETALADARQVIESGGCDRELACELQSLRTKYHAKVQERTALKTILETKMKALVDNIAKTLDIHSDRTSSGHSRRPSSGSNGSGQGRSQSRERFGGGRHKRSASASSSGKSTIPRRTRKELQILQRIVDASVEALQM